MPDMDKFCSMCGEDVTRQKHMKDREGELFCMACHATKRKVLAQQNAAQAANARAGTPAGAPTADAAMALPLGMPLQAAEPEPAPESAPRRRQQQGSFAPTFIIL